MKYCLSYQVICVSFALLIQQVSGQLAVNMGYGGDYKQESHWVCDCMAKLGGSHSAVR